MKIIAYKGQNIRPLGSPSSSTRAYSAKTLKVARSIVDEVAKNGDKALIKYTKKFDAYDFKPNELRITEGDMRDARGCVEPDVVKALKKAYTNIKRFHLKQYAGIKKSINVKISDGVVVGERVSAVESVGCYVPGGLASYPSSVLMSAIPASIAGVERIVIASPPPVSDTILVAADICGIGEIYSIGGAQAIAALAYGTQTVGKVSKIVGPGNQFVTAAKAIVYGDVDVDMPAGPSEILIIADKSANPHFIAADIIAQAEHDPNALCVLVTNSKNIAKNAVKEVKNQMEYSNRGSILRNSLSNCLAIVTKSMRDCVAFANDFAPEHLEIMTANPEKVGSLIKNAGAIFLGAYSPVAAGDYASGANHVLPTGGCAKFASPLSVRNFLKYTSIQKLSRGGLKSIGNTVGTLADAEGLAAHKKSVGVRDF